MLLEGRLHQVEVDASGARGVLDVGRADGIPVRARARLWWSDPARRPWEGQVLRLSAELREDVGPESWGEFDRGAASRARGLRTSGRVLPGSEVPLVPAPGWQRWLAQRREAFGRLAQAQVADPDAAALLGALGAGLRSELGPEWEERFARAGVAHVLSVSGLHVAALALAAALLLGLLLRCIPGCGRRLNPRRPAALAALPLVWGYVLFTGQQAPAVRSGVMLSVLLLGRLLQRHTDALQGLALAAGVLLVVDPAPSTSCHCSSASPRSPRSSSSRRACARRSHPASRSAPFQRLAAAARTAAARRCWPRRWPALRSPWPRCRWWPAPFTGCRWPEWW